MLGGLAGAGKALGGARFTLVNVLPGMVLATVVLAAAHSGVYGDGEVYLGRALLTDLSAAKLAGFALLALLFGVVAQPFQTAIVRMLEGYGWDRWAPSFLLEVCIERHRRQRDEAEARSSTSLPFGKDVADFEELARINRLLRRVKRCKARARVVLNRYPEEDRILPTRLGNTLRTGEDRAGKRYGLKSVAAYPRLYPYLSPRLEAAIRQQFDLLNTTCALCVAFLLAALATTPVVRRLDIWLLLPLVLFALALVSYASAVRAAGSLGTLYGVAFDLHRFDMLKALHYRPRDTVKEEEAFNRALSYFFQHGERLQLLREEKYHHLPEEQQTQSGDPDPSEGDGTENASNV